MTFHEIALDMASKGYSVFPLMPNSKIGYGTHSCSVDHFHGNLDATTDVTIIDSWWSTHPDSNVGIATGPRSGIFVLDIDSYNCPDICGAEPREIIQWAASVLNIKQFGQAEVVLTARGGLHLYYKLPESGIKTSAKEIHNCIDVRGNGGHVVSPGSVIDEAEYKVLSGTVGDPSPELLSRLFEGKTSTVDYQPLSENPWSSLSGNGLIDARSYADAKMLGLIQDILDLPNSGLESWGATIAGKAKDIARLARSVPGMDADQAKAQFYWALNKIDTPHHDSTRRSDAHWSSATSRTDFEPLPASQRATTTQERFARNDLGNAQRLEHYREGEVLWVIDRQVWLVFKDGKWTRAKWENAGQAFREMWECLPELEGRFESREPISDKANAKSLFEIWNEWYGRFSSINCFKNALEVKKTFPESVIEDEQTDRDPRYLGVQNGVLDLELGKLIPNEADMLVTRSTATDYDVSAACPTWDMIFKRQIPDPKLREWAETAIAVSTILEGNLYKYFVVLLSEHDTGKSKVLETIKGMMGSYGSSFDFSMIKNNVDPDKPRADLISVHRCRVITASEAEESMEISAGMLKKLTGSDSMKIRSLRSNDYVDSLPSYTPIVGFNSPPSIPGADKALRRRTVVIPFGESVPVHEQDDRLHEKLKAEWPGILAKFIRLIENKDIIKKIPREFSDATDDMFSDINPFQAFIEQATAEDPEGEEPNARILQYYSQWRAETGIGPFTDSSDLGRHLTNLNWKSAKSAKKFEGYDTNQRYRVGRKLIWEPTISGNIEPTDVTFNTPSRELSWDDVMKDL